MGAQQSQHAPAPIRAPPANHSRALSRAPTAATSPPSSCPMCGWRTVTANKARATTAATTAATTHRSAGRKPTHPRSPAASPDRKQKPGDVAAVVGGGDVAGGSAKARRQHASCRCGGPLRSMPGQLATCAALRMPGAAQLFERFLVSKGFEMLPGDAAIAAVAPVVLGDDTAMHALVALSARGAWPGAEVQARMHYGLALKTLQARVLRLVERGGDSVDLPATLLAVMLLCNFEVNDGDSHGASGYHLNAARKMIQLCTKDMKVGSADWTFLSFILDYFGYLSIMTSVVSINKQRCYICSDAQSIVPTMNSLEELRNRFGFDTSLSYPVRAELPQVARMSATRGTNIYEGELKDEDEWEDVDEEDDDDDNNSKLEAEEASEAGTPQSPPSPEQRTSQLLDTATQMLTQTALLVLYTTSHGPHPVTAALLAKTDPCVDEFYRHMKTVQRNRNVAASLMWPCILVGSCTRKPEQQDTLKAALLNSEFKSSFVRMVTQVLEHIWSGKDSVAFGPFGIKRVLALQNVRINTK